MLDYCSVLLHWLERAVFNDLNLEHHLPIHTLHPSSTMTANDHEQAVDEPTTTKSSYQSIGIYSSDYSYTKYQNVVRGVGIMYKG